jgi:transposase-like protein
LYFRFALSYRDVEELLAERGVIVTHETIRQWCQNFGQLYANDLRRPGLMHEWAAGGRGAPLLGFVDENW